MKRVHVLDTFGLRPLRPALRDAWQALAGNPHLPPSRWGPSSVRIFKPHIGLPTWLGLKRRDRRVPIYNFFNRVPQPPDEGYSVRATYARDFRGGRFTYDGHVGTDFASPVGTPVVAAAPGVVLRVCNEMNRGGLKVCIDHGEGLFTTSNHLSRALVEPGHRVARGEPAPPDLPRTARGAPPARPALPRAGLRRRRTSGSAPTWTDLKLEFRSVSMYVPRHLAAALREARQQLPVVLVTGPRQSGKSTLVRQELGTSVPYVSFDDPLEASFARDDPNGFLDRFTDAVILDEIQLVPSLMPYLKLRVDADRRPGRYVLTGSQQFAMMAQVSESLAGRVAILELLPFAIAELPTRPDLEAAIWGGAYPEPALHPDRRDLWLRGYIRTYVERDVRQMRRIVDLAAFEQLVLLTAAFHGQELNVARLARDVGMSQPTVKSWLGVLQAAYLGFTVPPYLRNLGKRLVKAPKWYLLDSALACELTRQPSAEATLAGSMGGALVEGLVVAEALKTMANAGQRPELYHWRSHDGLEVDLVVRTAAGMVPVEIKKTATPGPGHTKALARFLALEPQSAPSGLLVCGTREARSLPGGHRAIPWHTFGAWLSDSAV